MGKPTGFLEYARTNAGYRPVRERIQDFNEFVVPQPDGALQTQSARCMDCGVSFCHAGFVVDGLSIGCPLCNLIPEINDLVYRGEIEKAYARLSMTHPFPEFTSRVCPALCEGSCTLGEHEDPVTVKEIERYVVDEMIRRGSAGPRVPRVSTGKRVAVVGSGPSGLACADLLNQLGNAVTVFERADRPGGILMYGIPNMKLDKNIILRRVRIMEQEGVNFMLSTEVGAGYPALSLIRNFDAIVLCTGSTRERALTVAGAGLVGVYTALDFLTRSTKTLLAGAGAVRPDAAFPDVAGKQVVIVGGGDTGTDCVATSVRRGAAGVAQIEIMPAAPRARAENNPWPLWPKVVKTDYGQLEAIELFGHDPREYETTVKEILGENGKVTGVKTVKVEWKNNGSGLVPEEIPGSERIRPADLVVTAMGFTGPERTLIDQLNLKVTGRGLVAAEEDDMKTSMPTVFAAGDMRRGPSLVVWAIYEGRRAAKRVNEYLQYRG